ncbi:MAG: hypothetical protein AMJ69_06480 [Gammaproteobacteria bacterium SG8_47]|nr:MAG: hypothetical protein AMJ69_06480 [Gammaproteobacteria bacterium SG8_47]
MKRFGFLALSAAMAMSAAGMAQAGGDVDAGKTLAGKCSGCHGASGEGAGSNPALKGKSADAIAAALNDYKSGARKHTMMEMLAKPLSDADIANLAAFYSSIK